MAKNDQMPCFDDGKVYLVSGKTLNQMSEAAIIEINADPNELEIKDEKPNKVTIRLAGTWRSVTDCEGATFEVLVRNVTEAE